MPIAMAFDPQGQALLHRERHRQCAPFRERHATGRPVITFNVNSNSERGLLGIAIDPNFSTNHYIYVYYTCGLAAAAPPAESGWRASSRTTASAPTPPSSSPRPTDPQATTTAAISTSAPTASSISASATTPTRANSQDVTDQHGKMHRINPDGTIPADNPISPSRALCPRCTRWACATASTSPSTPSCRDASSPARTAPAATTR